MSGSFHALRKAMASQPQLPIWMMHIWQRMNEHKKLGLILGAGVTVDAGCPAWSDLVRALGKKTKSAVPFLKAASRSKFSEAYLAQILFQSHRRRSKRGAHALPKKYWGYYFDSTWMDMVHRELYRNVGTKSFSSILFRHRYLEHLAKLCVRCGFVINFNFDGLVDEAAIREIEKQPIKILPEIIYRPKLETRRGACIIYHINGYLPRERSRPRSDFLTFTEDAFADVLLLADHASSEFVEARFTTTTFLLLGTSLSDNSLKNMLRASMKKNSAHHHYIVYWEDAKSPRSAAERKQIFEVNLEVYNLISIFLTTDGIAELIEILNTNEARDFETAISDICPKIVDFRRRYYLVGAVSAGKSTILHALRSFTTFEEWLGMVPVEMYRDHNKLRRRQRLMVDKWLYGQLREKNEKMRNANLGIYVMDRAYFDLFAFSKTDAENLRKTSELRQHSTPSGDKFTQGHIIFLEADKDAFEERRAKRGRVRSGKFEYSAATLVKQSGSLKKIYQAIPSHVFDTGKTSQEITARQIARLILLGEYQPFDFEGRLDEVTSAGGKL